MAQGYTITGVWMSTSHDMGQLFKNKSTHEVWHFHVCTCAWMKRSLLKDIREK